MYTIFESRALTTPDAPLLIDPAGDKISYAAALSLVERIAGVYTLLGVKPGDRIAVQVEKSPLALLAYFASLRSGAVFLPVNTAYTVGELRYFLADAAPALFLCRPENAELAEQLCAETGVARFATLGPDHGSFNALLEGDLPPPPDYTDDPERIAAILYTSGTTGRSKGAMLSNANLLSNARALCEYWRFTAADRLLHALPIYHTHGLFVATNVTLYAGAAMVFLERFALDAVLEALPLSTTMMGVPTFYSRLLETARFDRSAASHMRLFISGSAPLSPPVHAAFLERTGHTILERYGMTETNMNTSNPYEGDRIAGSVGRALPGVEVRIVDPDSGEELPDGQSGMIEVRGPNVFSGYWRNPEKTAEAFRKDGFFITGDLGYRDARGYVFIMGRANDLIISGGLNIYPAEVENVLDAVPGVEESAVIGVPHPDLGEATVALLKASAPEVDQKFVLDAIAEQLARFKQPRQILIMDALPRNAMGKIQKAALRQRFANLFASEA
jgi:malonyl-CoA/methylmalonyl-CoA synthetase